MKRFCAVGLFVIVIFALPLSAQTQAPTQGPAQGNRSLGFIFEMSNVLASSLGPYNDNYQAGAGLKWWLSKNMAMRGLLGLNFNTAGGVITTDIGLSCGAEFHLAPAKVSPYFGGFVGTHALLAAANVVDIYFGGMGGVEMNIWENINVYAEYALLVSILPTGFSIGIGPTGGTRLGLILYF
jgi:hypothetical protein